MPQDIFTLREKNAPIIFRAMVAAGIPLEFHAAGKMGFVGLPWRGGTAAYLNAGFRKEEIMDALDWADRHYEQALKIAGLRK